MVSRDTTVHVAALLVGVGALLVAEYAEVGFGTGPESIAVLLVFYAISLGGAHLYLAVRGEDGLIPVESRWRYVATLAVLLATAAVIAIAGDRTVGPVAVRTIGLGVIGLAASGYLLTESLDGYRATRASED